MECSATCSSADSYDPYGLAWSESAELLYWRLRDIMYKSGFGDRQTSIEMIRRLLEGVYDAGKAAHAMGLED